MVALTSLLVVITISIAVVRMGSVALVMTGLSKDHAVFQAQSAFSGVGFTTTESESVVGHATQDHQAADAHWQRWNHIGRCQYCSDVLPG
jgi:hypothetical protein